MSKLHTATTTKFGTKLSPQQIQLMKLLQYPTSVLDERIKEELVANPALEQGDESDDMSLGISEGELSLTFAASESAEETKDSAHSEVDLYDTITSEIDLTEEQIQGDFAALDDHDSIEMDDFARDFMEDDPTSYAGRDGYNSDEDNRTMPVVMENTFHEHLEQQLGLLNIQDEEELAIAYQLLGSIDDDGYMRRELSAIVNDLMFSQNIITTEKELLRILKRIQQFDPPGVGCRNLQECLTIQLRRKLEYSDFELRPNQRLILQLAIRVVHEYFEEFTKKHYTKLQRYLDVTEEELKEANDEILRLNPKPASGYASKSDRSMNYIVPDFIINNNENELVLELNARNAPDLRISDHYREMLKDFVKRRDNGLHSTTKQHDAVTFIKDKISSAKWFIDAIRQRQQTMLRTMNAIMAYQYDYFLTGDQMKIKPMILKDIADMTGLDISTVSRVANSKFVQTEFGTKRLKEFFSESLQTEDGEEVSTIEVKKILTEIIGSEDKRKPLSDEKLRDMLDKKGYNIARRTVAKYREQLMAPVARLRKSL